MAVTSWCLRADIFTPLQIGIVWLLPCARRLRSKALVGGISRLDSTSTPCWPRKWSGFSFLSRTPLAGHIRQPKWLSTWFFPWYELIQSARKVISFWDSSWTSLPLRERRDPCEKAILNGEVPEQIADLLLGATYSAVWGEPVSKHASGCLEFCCRPTSCSSFTVTGYRECLLYSTLVTENLLDFLN